jgi:F-type H+-transporting ATPase subunit epsilon
VQVELVSPERILYSGEADVVIARTADGDIAFLENHAPFIGELGIGVVRIRHGNEEAKAAVHGGFVEVRNNRVIILSDVAELAEQIDVDRAREALSRAERSDDQAATAALRRAHVRLEAAGQS